MKTLLKSIVICFAFSIMVFNLDRLLTPTMFSKEFFAIIFFVALVMAGLERLFFYKKPKFAQINMNSDGTEITYLVKLKDIRKKYGKKLLHEVLSMELARLNAIFKDSPFVSKEDFDVSVSVSSAGASYFSYTLKAKTEKAKRILSNVNESIDLSKHFL